VSGPSALRAALESALAANPDDLAAHMAYADLLSEEGDPRGEFIRVQLAREAAEARGEDVSALVADERRLLALHEAAWLRTLHPLRLTDFGTMTFEATFRRGWVDSLDLYYLQPPLAAALARAPEARLLSRLRILDLEADVPAEELPPWDFEMLREGAEDEPSNPALAPLAGSASLANVRSLIIGGEDLPDNPDELDDQDPRFLSRVSGVGVVEIVRGMPRLEELRLLTMGVDTRRLFCLGSLGNLRVLQAYNCGHCPLRLLADNATFRGLTHLLLQPRRLYPDEQAHLRLGDVRPLLRSHNLPSLTHLSLRMSDIGDAGVEEIIASGILKRLNVLDLRYGKVTNHGAYRLASCPDARQLVRLVLSNNDLGPAGVLALQQAGVRAVTEEQGEGTDLFEFDME
jgi:uncharacterized protein (TIGR02996 family)